jgi:endonuclease-3
MPLSIQDILKTLGEVYPDPKLELTHTDAFELLVKAILAAQAPDNKVNEIAPRLLEPFPTPEALAKAQLTDIEEAIKEINFYRRKARALKEASQNLVDRFKGKVPENLEDLVSLRGVGRKTANMVRVGAFSLPGIVVDRHFERVAKRIGLTDSSDPEKIEWQLSGVVQEKDRARLSLLLISHGKTLCKAKDPKCPLCALEPECPFPKAQSKPKTPPS